MNVDFAGGGVMSFLVGLGWLVAGFVQGEPYWSLVGGVVISISLIVLGFLATDETE